jgi:hypothetical protein
VLVPHAVSVEVLAGPAEDPARILLEGGRLHSIPPAPIPDNIVEWGLGAGESGPGSGVRDARLRSRPR